MQRSLSTILLAALLAGCVGQQVANSPTPTLDIRPTVPAPTIAPAPKAAPSPTLGATASATAAPPTVRPTVPPATAAPTAPTAPATQLPATPAAASRATAIVTPEAPAGTGATLPDAPLDPRAQAKALLPEFAGDIDRAGEWNRYSISAAIDPQARTIVGRERIEYTNRDNMALDRLYFHLYPNLRDFAGSLDVSALTVDSQPREVAYERQRYLLRVDLPQPLAPGATSTVAFDFSTAAPQNASADFYGAFNKENGVLGLASSYPIAAIVRGGVWDIGLPDGRGDFVNSETALYDVTLTAPADWSLVTTGVVLDGRLDAGQQTVRIVSGPQRDFMISATQLQAASADVDGTRINSYYRAEHEQSGKLALQAAVDSLRIFNARYGRYPLAELDVIEVAARTFLGVEYPGLIMLEQGLYEDGNGLAITVAHEVAHQWWYSQVGNNVQTEAWLDEALASYSQIVYQEGVNGPEAAERELEGFRQRYRQALADGRDAPVAQPNTAFRGNYVSIVYGKAVLFFQAMRKQIGEEAFDRFLHTHYSQHRYGYIGGGDLLADAEGACSCDLDALYHDWIEEVGGVELP
jgi:peptidase M1-like protein